MSIPRYSIPIVPVLRRRYGGAVGARGLPGAVLPQEKGRTAYEP